MTSSVKGGFLRDDTTGALVIAGPGVSRTLAQSAVAQSHTGDLVEFTLASVTIPAGTLGVNGRVRVTTLWTTTNSANNKTLRVKLATQSFLSSVLTTSATARFQTELANRNAQNSQVGGPSGGAGGGWGTSTAAVVTTAVDMSVDQTLTITGQLALATETITLESYSVEIVPG